MYKDRGTIKWTAMMLPEHVRELREWRYEVDEKPPSALESWQQDELNEKISLAFEQQSEISLFLYEGSWIEERGIIQQLDAQQKLVFLADDLIVKRLPIYMVYRVTFHD